MDKHANSVTVTLYLDNPDNYEITGVEVSDASVEIKRNASENGISVLMNAATRGCVADIEFLVAHGANINALSDFKNSALIMAVINQHVECVEKLIELGADVTIKNNEGKTAIDLTDDDEIKKMLKEALRKQKVMNVKNKISGLFGREER